MPDRFRSLLIEGWFQFDAYEQPQPQTWFDCFCVCFQQALSKDPVAQGVFQTKLLANIVHQQKALDYEQFATVLQQLNEELAALNISDSFDELSSQLDAYFVTLNDHLGKFGEKVDRVVVKVEESTEEILQAQTEHTKTILGAIRRDERTPEDEFSTYTEQALRMIRDKLSLVEISLPRFEIARIEEQWQMGKSVLLTGQSGTGKSGIAAALAKQAGKPVLLIDSRNIAHLDDEPSLRRYFNLTSPLGQIIIDLAHGNGFRLIIDQFDNLIDKNRAANLLINLALECAESKVVDVVVISRNEEANEAQLLRPLIKAEFFSIESHKLPEGDVLSE